MRILVDTTIWLDYFRGTGYADALDLLIEENLVLTNELMLAELLPQLHVKNQKNLILLMKEVKQQPIRIDWDEIIQMQILCLKNGINGVGIPDLIIAQNAIQGDMRLFSSDRHFALIAKHTPLVLYQEQIA